MDLKFSMDDLMHGFMSTFMLCTNAPEFVKDLNFMLSARTQSGVTVREHLMQNGHGEGLDNFMAHLSMANKLNGEKIDEILAGIPSVMHDITEALATKEDHDVSKSAYQDLMKKLLGENYKGNANSGDVGTVADRDSNKVGKDDAEKVSDDESDGGAGIKDVIGCDAEVWIEDLMEEYDILPPSSVLSIVLGAMAEKIHEIIMEYPELLEEYEHPEKQLYILTFIFDAIKALDHSVRFFSDYYGSGEIIDTNSARIHCQIVGMGTMALNVYAEEENNAKGSKEERIDSALIDIFGGVLDALSRTEGDYDHDRSLKLLKNTLKADKIYKQQTKF
jgi:hypothetical protein